MQLHVCLLAVFFIAATARPKKLPVFTIDLDKPPRRRWALVGRHYRDWYARNYQTIDPKEVWGHWEFAQMTELLKGVDDEIKEEVEGLVEAFGHPHADAQHYLRKQLFYELGLSQHFGCTGLLATHANGSVIHGRNLDLATRLSWIRDATFYADFVKGGERIARGIQTVGLVGISTGVRFGLDGWSVEQNTRDMKIATDGVRRTENQWVKDTLAAVKDGGKFNPLELRRLMLQKATFLEAVDALANTRWAAPQYFILGGTNRYQGAVITVNRAPPRLATPTYDIQLLGEASGHWFLVQTNDDHWKPAQDGRRKAAANRLSWQHRLRGEGQGYVEEDIMEDLRTPPVCNQATMWSWVITPATEKQLFEVGTCGK